MHIYAPAPNGAPDILEFPCARPHGGRLRRIAAGTIVLTAFVATAVTTQRTDRPAVPETPRVVPQATVQDQVVGGTPFVAPTEVEAGGSIYLVATRRPGLCGPEDLRFDGRILPLRVLAASHRAGAEARQIIASATLPATARPGPHVLTVYGPVPSTRGGIVCGDRAERHALIATIRIAVNRAGLETQGIPGASQ
jgi:hypothetical protein